VHADIEKPKSALRANNSLTIVVLPEPEGAENMMSLPSKNSDDYMNQQNKGIKINIRSRMDDIFERMLSIKLAGQVDVHLDFKA
jgi:hypothetical protein